MKWKLNEDMRTGLLVGAVLVLFGFAYLLVGQDEVVGQVVFFFNLILFFCHSDVKGGISGRFG